MTRYPILKLEDMYYEQRRVAETVARRRKPSASSEGGLEGPFVPLAYAPGILDNLQHLGELCRLHTSIPPKLRELAIIITARHVSAQLEFHVHAIEAREFGMAEEKIQAIASQQAPPALDEDEGLVYTFCTEIHATGRASDSTLQAMETRFGKAMIIEFIATCGYYKTLGLSMNVTHPAIPKFLENFPLPFPTPSV